MKRVVFAATVILSVLPSGCVKPPAEAAGVEPATKVKMSFARSGQGDTSVENMLVMVFDEDGSTVYSKYIEDNSEYTVTLPYGRYSMWGISNCASFAEHFARCTSKEEVRSVSIPFAEQRRDAFTMLLSAGGGDNTVVVDPGEGESSVLLSGSPFASKVTIRKITNGMTPQTAPLCTGEICVNSVLLQNVLSSQNFMISDETAVLFNSEFPDNSSGEVYSEIDRTIFPGETIAADRSLYCFPGSYICLAVHTSLGYYNIPIGEVLPGKEYIVGELKIFKPGGQWGEILSSEGAVAGMDVSDWTEGGICGYDESLSDAGTGVDCRCILPETLYSKGECVINTLRGRACVASSDEDVLKVEGAGHYWKLFACGRGRTTLTISDGVNEMFETVEVR